jgi:hypothetical protein
MAVAGAVLPAAVAESGVWDDRNVDKITGHWARPFALILLTAMAAEMEAGTA